MASCGLAIVALSIPNADPGTFSRVLQGLVTGIGFVGAGAIVRGRGSVSSAATAASIWCIGIAGAAVGLKAYHIAIALSVANFLTLQLLAPLKRELDTTNSKRPAE
jgi:putative Mg2+ transporter-C (MgtC) family protein